MTAHSFFLSLKSLAQSQINIANDCSNKIDRLIALKKIYRAALFSLQILSHRIDFLSIL